MKKLVDFRRKALDFEFGGEGKCWKFFRGGANRCMWITDGFLTRGGEETQRDFRIDCTGFNGGDGV